MIKLNGQDRESTLNTTNAKQIATGTYHLASNPNLYEVQRTNNFEFVVTDIDNLVRAGALGTENQATILNGQEVLRLSNVSSSVPHFEQNVISVRRGNNEMKFAGTPTFSSGTVRFNNYIGADTISVLMAWQNLSYNVRTEKVGLVSDYKKDAYLIEYTPDLQEVRKWKLTGCWISNITEDEYNSENSDKKKIDVTIQYDRAEIDLTNLT